LGKTNRRFSFERRLRLWLAIFFVPSMLFAVLLLAKLQASTATIAAVLTIFLLGWLIAATAFMEQILRPLQTLANVVAALREDDFSFRARGARRGDALGDLALEINALAGTLQTQRSAALEALTLVERVMSSMQSPVLAFDAEQRLRLHNAAADRSFGLSRPASDGRTAAELRLDALLQLPDEGVHPATRSDLSDLTGPRYAVRRTTFRLRGVPHVLLVLSDVGAALRAEERQAWQRLIRVLGHEINNSLTPIKSIAGSLRARIPEQGAATVEHVTAATLRDFTRGLAVIEDRAASLNRFLQAYQQLSTLPAPHLQSVPLGPLLERVAHLETRITVRLIPGPEAMLLADPDQLQQVLINLIQNAADAALEATVAAANDPPQPAVEVQWSLHEAQASIRIIDNGLGLLNPVNLFVPFYTTKPNGTGIGLALAQQILIAHKGTVSLLNRADGQGCVAEVRLPLDLDFPG
jgi:two-component system, NtrC family, nitrogen regulation sensor histidine kinase NtrY